MAWTDLTAHGETCEHRMIKCQYCENSYKPDEEELHLQQCGLYWKEKCNNEKLKAMEIHTCPWCNKRLLYLIIINIIYITFGIL